MTVLRERILSGALPPGSRIRLEAEADRLGMSLIPLREALRSLASQGLVDALSRRGYRVSSVSKKDLDDTYQMRLVLDALAVRLAVPRFTAEASREVDVALADLSAAIRSEDTSDYRVAHRRFHFSIFEQCDSRWLLRFIEVLWENSRRYQQLSAGPRGTPEQRIQEHQAIARACQSGDAQRAEELTLRHLKRTWVVAGKLIGTQI